MKKSLIALSLITLLNIPGIHAAVGKKHLTPEMEYNMREWKDAAAVGKEHKVLNKAVGNWNYHSKWWLDPNQAPMESNGHSKMKMILGGRFLQNEVSSKSKGKSFEGVGFIGYDNLQEGYDVIWMDNMSTGILRATAAYDEDTKTLTEVGQYPDPTAPDKNQKYKAEWKFIDKNNMTYTTFIEQDGLPMKQLEIVYKRVK